MADDDVKFELKLIGRLNAGQVASRPQQTNPDIERKRHDQETGRRLSNEYAEEALLTVVHTMRTTPDENIRLRAANTIMDRAWGKSKPLTEEEKKGADAGSILDVLAAVSEHQGRLERQAPDAPAIEHESTDADESFEKLMDDINTEDAVLIDG